MFLPGESHGQRSLAGCSPWGCKESDTPEQLSMCAGGVCSSQPLFLTPWFYCWLFRSRLGLFGLFCILLSLIWLNCACTQLFSVPYSYFVFCCWRRCLSRCKPCSKVSPVHLLSNTRDLFVCSVVRWCADATAFARRCPRSRKTESPTKPGVKLGVLSSMGPHLRDWWKENLSK